MRYKNIFVLGGTGFVGTVVLRALKAQGHHIGVLSRNEEESQRLTQDGFRAFIGDISSETALTGALREFGADALVHLVGIIKEIPPAVTFERIHVEGTRAAVNAAKAAGIKKIIYISAIGANAEGSTAYFRTKAAAEKLISESGIPYTIFRPSSMFGKNAGFTKELVSQIRKLPFVPVLGNGRYPFQVVAVDVTAHCIAGALELPASDGRIYDIVGPEVLTMKEITRRLKKNIGSRKPMISIPIFLMKLVALASALGLPVPITNDQLTMVQEGSVGNGASMERDFGPRRIPFDPAGMYPLF